MNSTNGFALTDVIDTSASSYLHQTNMILNSSFFNLNCIFRVYKTNLSFETNTYISLLPSITPKTPPDPSKCGFTKEFVMYPWSD
jgi:hypothetical protein